MATNSCSFWSFFLVIIAFGFFIAPVVSHNSRSTIESLRGTLDCDTCKIGLDLIDFLIRENSSEAHIIDGVYKFCVETDIQVPSVCRGILDTFGPIVITVVTTTNFSNEEICVGTGFCPPPTPDFWQERFAQSFVRTHPTILNKPPRVPKAPKSKQPREAADIGYALQLSDMHWDWDYQVGSIADCDQPLCCRDINTTGNIKAGKWGSYLCDIPLISVQALMTQLSNFTFDMILWTGDNPPHDVWEQNPEHQIKISQDLADMITAAFPTTPTYPCLGNHESYPCDQYTIPGYEWLSGNISQIWSPWLPASAIETAKRGLYYVVSPAPGLRLISLNTQSGDDLNFYWLLNPEMDIGNQTNWFIAELLAAEEAGDKVWVIGHIACTSNSATIPYWCDNLEAIYERFQDTIIGNFFGHTHRDQFVNFFGSDGNLTTTQWLAPSVTTYTNLNPSFRVYLYDKNTFEVIDWQQWSSNITKANLVNGIEWNLVYTLLEEYQMEDTSPESFQHLFDRMLTNSTLLDSYLFHYQSQGPMPPCGKNCVSQLICQIQSSTYEKYATCMFGNATLPYPYSSKD